MEGRPNADELPFSFLRATVLILPIAVLSWYVSGRLTRDDVFGLDRQIVASMIGSVIFYPLMSVPTVQRFLYGKQIY